MTDVIEPTCLEMKAGTKVTIVVYATTNPIDGEVAWDHEWKFDGHSEKKGRIDVPQKKNGQLGTPLKFILHDDTDPKVGLSFVDNKGAIWVSRTECPVRKDGVDPKITSDPEITGIKPKGDELKAFDENEEEVVLHFNLRFDPDPDKYFYDPEIKNGGKVRSSGPA